MGVYGFYLSNIVVSFVSDILLNDLSSDQVKKLTRIKTLRPYFDNKLIVLSGLYASITIGIALIPVSITTQLLFKQSYPNTHTSLFKFCIIAFIYGYIIDILIDHLKIFGTTLDQYYKEFGRGLWGAIALIVSIITSYILNNYLIPIL
tara:strand:+ start:339 stop:782 length:444 start_codon:yes stop_codon:yes gene_type:complete